MPSEAPKGSNMPGNTPPRRRRGGKTEERIRHLITLMVSGNYITHITPARLAIEWGVAPNTVEHYACEASRRLRATTTESPELRARIKANMEVITVLALKSKRLRDAIEAQRLLLGVVSLEEQIAREEKGQDVRVHLSGLADLYAELEKKEKDGAS